MHPRYIINHKETVHEATPAEDGGKNPKWMADYDFDIGTDLETAGVMNFTFLENDDLIADAEISVETLVNDRDEANGVWHDINFDGEVVGKFLIIFKYGEPPEPPVPAEEAPHPAGPPSAFPPGQAPPMGGMAPPMGGM